MRDFTLAGTGWPNRCSLTVFGLGSSALAAMAGAQEVRFAPANYRGLFHAQDVLGAALNVDGLLDVAVIAENHFIISFNDGVGGATTAARPVTDGRGPLLTGDLDGDDRPDVVHREVVDGRPSVTVVYNFGLGRPPEVHHFALPSGYYAPRRVFDVDGDGRDDIVLIREFVQQAPVIGGLLSGARGEFRDVVLYSHPENWRVLDFVEGDFDDDGDADLCALYARLSHFAYYVYT